MRGVLAFRGGIEAVAATLNARPRKTLGWKTPAEALDDHLKILRKYIDVVTGM